MLVLGFETSCDETSVSIVENGQTICSNIVLSQIKDHQAFGGVVPEIASRKHLERIHIVVDEAFLQAGLSYKDIHAVAVVSQPGLLGSLLIGLSFAKAFAFQYEVPLIPVNHLEAHLYAPHLEQKIHFPNLGLVVSGGHTLLFKSYSPTDHQVIGSTIDDAVGECFDKVAKFFGLGYPGGPVIDQQAKIGNPLAFQFPKPSFKKNHPKKYQWSYSGLKTAVIHQRNQFTRSPIHTHHLPDILASFQKIAIDMILDTTLNACSDFNIHRLVISGGVACNSYLRKIFQSAPITPFFSSLALSTDNAAMVAGIGYHLLKKGHTSHFNLTAFPSASF